ncbi:MAG: hypothetical protein AAGF44_02980, partial [Pseudomonadota bacterium]
AEIEDWIAEQASGKVRGPAEKAIEDINLITQWVVKEAGDEDVLAHADPILLAVHDLRHEIVRRLSKVGAGSAGNGGDEGED